MSTLAEAKLASTRYDGEMCHWNFKKYMKIHIDQHAILAVLVERGYSGIDERSKVRHLMNGIKTRDLDPVKTQILLDAVLPNDLMNALTCSRTTLHRTPLFPKSRGYRLSKLVPRRKMRITLKLICPWKTATT